MVSPFRTDVLSGKCILVSGGGTGLGKGIATSFAEHGATVYICGRREVIRHPAECGSTRPVPHRRRLGEIESDPGSLGRRHPIGRSAITALGEMHELQNIMIFLMADGCDYITGQTIGIDGGQHLAAPSTFAGLAKLTEAQWAKAKEAMKASAAKEKAQRTV